MPHYAALRGFEKKYWNVCVNNVCSTTNVKEALEERERARSFVT
jgi:hypothetical protein